MFKRLRKENINTQKYWDNFFLYKRPHITPFEVYDAVYNIVFKHIGKPKVLLEIGCGEADNLNSLFRKYKIECTGCDFSDILLKRNIMRFPKLGFFNYNCNIDNLCEKVKETQYSAAISIHHLEHIENIVFHIDSVLKVTNYYIICVPYKDNWGNSPEHLWFFDENSFDQENINGEIVEKIIGKDEEILRQTITYVFKKKD